VRIVAISMVKNEADVIEPFCRHIAAFADHHLVFDHRSTDGTNVILKKLMGEGLPLTCFHDHRIGKLQDVRTTELMHRAVRDFGADWVLPLDADEFLQDESPAAVRTRLTAAAGSTVPIQMWLADYGFHPDDDQRELNPVLRLRHRVRAELRSAAKVLIPRRLAGDPAVRVAHGNHAVLRNGSAIPAQLCDDLSIAHFPARSGEQVAVKVLTGEWQRLAHAAPAGIDDHYRSHVLRLLGSPRQFLADPGHYLRGEHFAPAAYWGGALRYPPLLSAWERAIAALLPFVEDLARSHGEHRSPAGAPILTGQRTSLLSRIKKMFRRSSPELPANSELFEGLRLPDSTNSDALSAEIQTLESQVDERAIHARIRIRNTALTIWKSGPADGTGRIMLSTARCARQGIPSLEIHSQHPLPSDLDPGEAMEMTIAIPRPDEGDLFVNLERQGFRWFSSPGQRLLVPDVAAASARAA
jgi:hypothetical protein